MRILLIEPAYRNKYPPLGLMKISSFHKMRGDTVVFFKGISTSIRDLHRWDRIYISTLFTFQWNITVKTIRFYMCGSTDKNNIFIGGAMANLMTNELRAELGSEVRIVKGLLNKSDAIGLEDEEKIDRIVPDYEMISCMEDVPYKTINAFFVHATRGCPNNCTFCAVPLLEGPFKESDSIKKQVEIVRKTHGDKRSLMIMDNNILASNRFDSIIGEIVDSGFAKGELFYRDSKSGRRGVRRTVDFNQGVDARLLTQAKAQSIAKIAIEPLRIAFDDIKSEKLYIKAVKYAADAGIRTLSNYILFNYKDAPSDFYRRLEINIQLNNEFSNRGYDTRIWSFPMRYSPIFGFYAKGRKFIGKNWSRKYIRGVQCILLATHGVVGPKEEFFRKAFGRDYGEFQRIVMSPESYIIWRKKNERRNKYHWDSVQNLSTENRSILLDYVRDNKFTDIETKFQEKELIRIAKRYKYLKKEN